MAGLEIKPQEISQDKAKEAPSVTPEQKEWIDKNLPLVRKDLSRFLDQWEILKQNSGQAILELSRQHPKMIQKIEMAETAATVLRDQNQKLKNEDILKAIDDYNTAAIFVNSKMRDIKNIEKESGEKLLLQGAAGELPFDESEYTVDQKAELQKFSKDLWDKLFPESNVDQFVKWANGQKELMDVQKYLLIPANGVESVVMGFVNLGKKETYSDLVNAAQVARGMSYEDWCDTLKTLKFTYKNLSTVDKAAPILSFLFALTLLVGGMAKLGNIAKQMGYSPWLIKTLQGIRTTRTITHLVDPIGKALPLAVMTGISLPIIKKNGPYSRNQKRR